MPARGAIVPAAWMATIVTIGVIVMQQTLHRQLAERGEPGLLAHALRDGAMAWPAILLAVLVSFSPAVVKRIRRDLPEGLARAGWALVVALCVGAVMVPGTLVHGWLFVDQEQHSHAMGAAEHLLRDAASGALIALVVCLLLVSVTDPWAPTLSRSHRGSLARAGRRAVVTASAAAVVAAGLTSPAVATTPVPAATPPTACAPLPELAGATRIISADVVALDQAFDYNRLGATNPAGMIFALRHDVVLEADVAGVPAGTPITAAAATDLTGAQLAGNVTLRPEKRPRPLALRMAVGDCLEITFQNLLGAQKADAEQPGDRRVGVHVKGLAVVKDITDDGTAVGRNPVGGLVAPGDQKTYTLFAEHEGGFVLDNGAARGAGEAVGGTTPFGLFGAVNVEPWGTNAYRSQLTRVEMDLAASAWDAAGNPTDLPQYDANGAPAVRLTPDGQPILNYDARYPTDPAAAGFDAARAGMPIVRMVDDDGTTAHSDLNAVIAGPRNQGWKIPDAAYPADYWDNQVVQENQRRGEEPFREFTVIFHDDIFALQAFPELFDDPATFQATLHGVRDGFGINYGVAGVGAEVIANRLKNAAGKVGVGPMADCIECKYEEFFLTAWAVGDPAMIVDTPANKVLAGDAPAATLVKFPDDPSNVHHSYLNDRVKFRNLHAGPKEHHIFHLHAHQWQQTPNEKKSNYLDSQLIGPGAAYTYDIAYGGSGNRNKTVGDSIFHCHFYPHFAQGMWELWRVHDTFERGTVMDGAGRPAAGSRALPDGEIAAGTPIPAIVPLPSRPMAPMPLASTTVVATTLPGASQPSSQIDVNGDGTADVEQSWLAGMDPVASNPGYPFFVAGVAGHRPPTPPLDIPAGEDGGLSRHVITGGTATSFVTPRDFNKILDTAQITYVPEEGTPAEQAAMGFHAKPWHDTYTAEGAPVNAASPMTTGGVGRTISGFETNGLPAQPGAPFADPCRTDGTGSSGPDPGHTGTQGTTADPNITYKAAVVQLDATFNKAGWHFPQQRIEALWEDAAPTITGDRAPEPLVMRIAAGDCTELWHGNLVPNVYELDDYQVRTPTDVIGQHIHLVKFDVTSADGSGNGFNYEDGTLSPQEVEERIHAVREGTKAGGQPIPGAITSDSGIDPVAAGECAAIGNGDARLQSNEINGTSGPTPECPLATLHPFFGLDAATKDLAWGARTTVQRWYADPVLNESWDRGHGSVFTHDHFGPSTHQQTGLYATVLIEPEGSTWRDPETGAQMTGRHDGGPTSWRADILTEQAKNSHREFYLELGDFEHAYTKGGGQLTEACNNPAADGSCADGIMIPSYADPANVVNPSHRVPPASTPDLFKIPADCPNGTPRPCPEAISADDIGTQLVNYRNEPLAHRVFDPVTKTQAAGEAGDLAFAFQSREDRAMPELNTQSDVYGPRTGVKPGDPFTPLLRAYAGDLIRVRFQVGATEEQHNVAIQGLKWKEEALSAHSGWRNSRPGGISEYFIAQSPVLPNTGKGSPAEVDTVYMTGAADEDLWNGSWGLLRAYQKATTDLVALPGNDIPGAGWSIDNLADFDIKDGRRSIGAAAGICPTDATLRKFVVYAVQASKLTGPDGLVYNDRGATLQGVAANGQGLGADQAVDAKLVDPTALVYVLEDDVLVNKKTWEISGLKAGVKLRPLTLRANAGDCINVELRNTLPAAVPELPGYNALPPIVTKRTEADGSQVTFNANDLRTSTNVGLHASLVTFDPRNSNGMDVGGRNVGQTIPSGGKKAYVWYAGDVSVTDVNATTKHLVARPVEFGAIGLSPVDPIKQSSKGLVGALVVEPPGATWTEDPGDRTQATVTLAEGSSFRELVAVLQDNVNLRYSGDCPGVPADMQCAVPAVASEGKGVPEDSEDSGQKAVNYQSDPVWYRLGVAPDVPFELLRDNTDTALALSNQQVGGADPSVPILTAKPGQSVRMRVVQPGGHARGHVLAVNGHTWMRQPSVGGTGAGSDLSDRLTWSFADDPTAQDTTWAGHRPNSTWSGGAQDGVGPAIQQDYVLPRAGGPFQVEGDYLISDAGSFGSYQGMWSLLRVQP